MTSQWHFVPFELQRITRFDPNSPIAVTRVGDPITDLHEIEELLAHKHEILDRNGLIPTEYTTVYRITSDDGTEVDYMARGHMMA